jgi:hypothetical protein
MLNNASIGRLIPLAKYCESLGINPRTGKRWQKADPGFPTLIDIHGKHFVEENDGERYKRVLIRRGTEDPGQSLSQAHAAARPPPRRA